MLDFWNTFNSMRRDKILVKVKEHVPGLYHIIWQSYADASNLYFSDGYVIRSEEGIQQGDPLGPFQFSLGLSDLVRSGQSELSA